MTEESGTRLEELIRDEDSEKQFDIVFAMALQETIGGVLRKLSGREMRIIALRFGLEGEGPHTLEQTGRLLGITRERVRQIPVFAAAGRAFALEPDGTLLEAADGSPEVRTRQLPALPQGFVYTDLLVAGATLVATWEQVDFFRVGTAGMLIVADNF